MGRRHDQVLMKPGKSVIQSLKPTLWLFGNYGITAASGQACASWTAKSGGMAAFTQATGTAQPTFTASVLNGIGALTFDGATDYLLHGAPLLSGAAGTVFVVHRHTAHDGDTIFAQSDTGDNDREVRLGVSAADLLEVYQCNNDTADLLRSVETLAINTWHVSMWSSDGFKYACCNNGLNLWMNPVTGADTGDWFADVTGSVLDNTVVGGAVDSGGLSGGYKGQIAEVVAFDRVLTGLEQRKVMFELCRRYSVTIPALAEGTVISNFSSLADFTLGGTGATRSLTTDPALVFAGTASTKVAGSGTSYANLTKTFDPHQDWTDKTFTLRFYVHDYPATSYVSILAYTGGTSARYKFTRDIHQNGWHHWIVRNSEWQVDNGAPDISAVSSIVIYVGDSSGSTNPSTVTFDLCTTDYPGPAIFVLTFDDGEANVYDVAYPAMASAGFRGVCYVITSQEYDETELMTTEELTTLYNAGWDICGHTHTHTDLAPGVDPATIEYECQTSLNWLLANGFTRSARHMAYPHNQHDETARQIVAKYFNTARASAPLSATSSVAAVNGAPHSHPTHVMNVQLPSKGVQTLSTADFATFVDAIVAAKRFTCLYWHNVGDGVDFATNLAYLKGLQDAGSCIVMTITEYYDWLQRRYIPR